MNASPAGYSRQQRPMLRATGKEPHRRRKEAMMPLGDGTGPTGPGPVMGRGLGRGKGFGHGAGRGHGLGICRTVTTDEIAGLQERITLLETALEMLKQRRDAGKPSK
jgi:hypothetical protein